MATTLWLVNKLMPERIWQLLGVRKKAPFLAALDKDRDANSFATHQSINAEAGSSVYAVLHGDMHIRNGYPVYQFIPFSPHARAVPPERAAQQPSRLLAAESQVVTFNGRVRELAELTNWRDDPTLGVSAALVHAPGGQGKTRLSIEFAADSLRTDWTVWAAHHLSDPTAHHIVAPGDTGRALVLIVDYADRWPLDDLLLLFHNPVLRRPQRTRVLLIARSSGPWWPALRHRIQKSDIGVGPTIPLPPMAETPHERQEMFFGARDAFAAALGLLAVRVPAPPRLDDDGFRLVLAVHMAALVAVDACMGGRSAPSDPVGLSAYLLDREQDFWNSLHDHDQITTAPRLMGRTVFTATLTGPLRRAGAAATIEHVGIATGVSAQRTLSDHAVCYPPWSPEIDTVMTPLYPDRLGEDYLALTMPGHAQSDYAADLWVEGATRRLLGSRIGDVDMRPEYVGPAVVTLISTAARWPHVAENVLYPVLRNDPRLAVDAGGVALATLADIPELDMTMLDAIVGQLPTYNLHLAVGAAALTRRFTEYLLPRTADPAERAVLQENLVHRLMDAGLYEEAVNLLSEMLALVPDLPRLEHTSELIDLIQADELGKLSISLGELVRVDDALDAAEQAVEVLRGIDSENSGVNPTRQVNLADALHALGIALSRAGLRREAVEAVKEAVDIKRRLAGTSEENLGNLSGSLCNLGLYLEQVGLLEQGLAATQEATEIARVLAASRPERHDAGLAFSLNNLGDQLRKLGRPEEALTVTREAAKIKRRIARSIPSELPSLAGTLSNLGGMLSHAGHHDEALLTSEEAVEIVRPLATANPIAYQPKLAAFLNNLGDALARAGDRERALTTSQEALSILRPLADLNMALQDQLALTLGNTALRFQSTGRFADALGTAREAESLYTQLTSEYPDLFDSQLRRVQDHIEGFLAFQRDLDRISGEFTQLGDEIAPTAVWQRIVNGDTSSLLDELESRLEDISPDGDTADAHDSTIVRDVALNRRLSKANPSHIPELARSLVILGNELLTAGDFDDAAAATSEAESIYRGLAESHPGLYEHELAWCIDGLVLVLVWTRQWERALAAANELVEIRRRLAGSKISRDLAEALMTSAMVRVTGGLELAAVYANAMEALGLCKELAVREPIGLIADLVVTCNTIANTLDRLGQAAEATALRSAARRSVGRFRHTLIIAQDQVRKRSLRGSLSDSTSAASCSRSPRPLPPSSNR